MKRIGLIFPGQGAQKIGMGKDFYDTFSAGREIYDMAEKELDLECEGIVF